MSAIPNITVCTGKKNPSYHINLQNTSYHELLKESFENNLFIAIAQVPIEDYQSVFHRLLQDGKTGQFSLENSVQQDQNNAECSLKLKRRDLVMAKRRRKHYV